MFMSREFYLGLERRESLEVKRVRHFSYARGISDVAPRFEPLHGAKCI